MIPDKQVKAWKTLASTAAGLTRPEGTMILFQTTFDPNTVMLLLNELDAHHDEVNAIISELQLLKESLQ